MCSAKMPWGRAEREVWSLRVEEGRIYIGQGGGKHPGANSGEGCAAPRYSRSGRRSNIPGGGDIPRILIQYGPHRNYHARRRGQIDIFGGFMRCGTDRRPVDNWAAGGIAVGLGVATGRLLKQGIYAPGMGGGTTSHPETGFVFEGFKVPH